MSIAPDWRSASGTAPALRLIDSAADNQPPFWQVTCAGADGAVVELYARPPRVEGFAPLGALTLAAAETIEEIDAV